MAGSVEGGRQAAETNKAKYGDSFYQRIGALGGKASGTGGFYANRELARRAGKKGGEMSRRGKKLALTGTTTNYTIKVKQTKYGYPNEQITPDKRKWYRFYK